jgi:hypothetical protein
MSAVRAPVVDDGMLMFAPELACEIAGYETTLFETHGGKLAFGGSLLVVA